MNPLWSAAEVEQLQELAGDLPRKQLMAAYDHWTSERGYQHAVARESSSKPQASGFFSRPVATTSAQAASRRSWA